MEMRRWECRIVGIWRTGFYGTELSANQVTADLRIESLHTYIAEDGLWLRKLT
jgi:hypothetical protein